MRGHLLSPDPGSCTNLGSGMIVSIPIHSPSRAKSGARMKKVFAFFSVSILCAALAIRYFRPDFSWFAEASGENSSNVADMNQPMPHAVMPAADDNWVDMESYKGKVVLINFWTT